MDANGQRFWMLSRLADWRTNSGAASEDTSRRTIRLASRREMRTWPVDENAARTLREAVPQALDEFHTRALLNNRTVQAVGAFADPTDLFALEAGDSLTDMTPAAGAVLAVAINNRVQLRSLLNHWEPLTLEPPPGFAAWKLAAGSEDDVWVLGRDGSLGLVTGRPRRELPFPPYAPGTPRPCEENPWPPRFDRLAPPVDGEEPVAIAMHAGSGLALLTWAAGGEARLRLFDPARGYSAAWRLAEVAFPYSLRWLDHRTLCVLITGVKEAPAYQLDNASAVLPPLGDFYPLRDPLPAPFLQSQLDPPRYLSTSGPVPLRRLPLPSYASGVQLESTVTLDSQSTGAVWHRAYVEAHIPPGCGLTLWAAATATPNEPVTSWFPHHFGAAASAGAPQAAWSPLPSEIPFHEGLLPCPAERDRAGLFTVLLQRAGLRVRSLQGRYLRLRMELHGTGLTTPEVAAVRIYASRFSYLNQYLPELYRETLFGREADAAGPATGPDFLERFLDNCEGIFTTLEDRIARADLLTRPESTPDNALPWLASWVGLAFDPAYPEHRRRELLRNAPLLYRRHGTLPGLAYALNIATDGLVERGAIVLVEDFRLRRVFATILGANLEDYDDPLTLGLAKSGNSFVGDSLFLGDENRKEFLALFNADLKLTSGEQRAVERLFDELAHRLTVLVHAELDNDLLGVIRRIVQLEAPAHLLTRIAPATERFLVGIASLTGIDTFLEPKPRQQPVREGHSRIGMQDYLTRPPSLDPRLGSPLPPRRQPPAQALPVADLGPDFTVPPGRPLLLDASRSRPAPGRTLERFIWTRMESL